MYTICALELQTCCHFVQTNPKQIDPSMFQYDKICTIRDSLCLKGYLYTSCVSTSPVYVFHAMCCFPCLQVCFILVRLYLEMCLIWISVSVTKVCACLNSDPHSISCHALLIPSLVGNRLILYYRANCPLWMNKHTRQSRGSCPRCNWYRMITYSFEAIATKSRQF